LCSEFCFLAVRYLQEDAVAADGWVLLLDALPPLVSATRAAARAAVLCLFVRVVCRSFEPHGDSAARGLLFELLLLLDLIDASALDVSRNAA
jgi:hypothetical protein